MFFSKETHKSRDYSICSVNEPHCDFTFPHIRPSKPNRLRNADINYTILLTTDYPSLNPTSTPRNPHSNLTPPFCSQYNRILNCLIFPLQIIYISRKTNFPPSNISEPIHPLISSPFPEPHFGLIARPSVPHFRRPTCTSNLFP